jgi:hypothetical protein
MKLFKPFSLLALLLMLILAACNGDSSAPATLTVTRTGDGAVVSSPAGISCGNSCSAQFPSGTTVTLQATPTPTSWGGACQGTTGNQCQFVLTSNATVSVAFPTGDPDPDPDPDPDNTVIRRISEGSDDAEEYLSDWQLSSGASFSAGSVGLTSSGLYLTYDLRELNPVAGSNQLIGLRFTNITIPAGATITSATLQFTPRNPPNFEGAPVHNNSGPTNLVIQAQAATNPPTFSTATNNISSRPKTTASVNWNVPAWTAGPATADSTSPNLSAVVQEVVNQSGWSSGNSIVFIISGDDNPENARAAWSFNGNADLAPVLTITYEE